MAKITAKKLEQILGELHSDLARSQLIFCLLDKKVTIPDKYLHYAINDYEKAGRFYDAAAIAQKAGFTERADTLYRKVIDVYEKAGQFYAAAAVAQKAGFTERAIDIYKKARWFNYAADVAEEAGFTERADLYKTIAELLK